MAKDQIYLKKALYFELAVMIMGEYIMKNDIIPSTCRITIKSIMGILIKNSGILKQLLKKDNIRVKIFLIKIE